MRYHLLAFSAVLTASQAHALDLRRGSPTVGPPAQHQVRRQAGDTLVARPPPQVPASAREAAEQPDASDLSVKAPSGVVARTLAQRAADRITLEDLGGGTDKTASENCTAFMHANAKGRTIQLRDGDYHINCTIIPPIAENGRSANIVGNGPDRTRIVNTTSNLPTIKINGYVSYVRLVGFTLTRTPAAVAGGDGLMTNDYTTQAYLSSVWSEKNYHGFNLKSTDIGFLENLKANNNAADGFLFTNDDNRTPLNRPLQWQFMGRTYSIVNGGWGYRVQANAGTLAGSASQLVLGDWDGLSSFGNGRGAVGLFGAAALPIQDLRLRSFFFGSDNTASGAAEIYLDTYGYNHTIGGGIVEECKFCILVTSNNKDIHIAGTKFSDSSLSAINSAAPYTLISGISNRAAGVDRSAAPANRAVVQLNGADSMITSSLLRGGTYGVVVGGVRSAITSTLIRDYTSGRYSVQPDTSIRAVPGVADVN